MASFSSNTATSSSSNIPSNIAGRELNLIASSFVKQYYTLLNKAPCYIHNFYSQSSTFIHGTVEVANEHFTEPIIGREKIQSKMEEMKLNDCRAKIKQIDCLETLAGGLVIQVIGELSNNGKPMRPFMQTFVLAPSPDEARQDGKDPSHQRPVAGNDARRGVHVNENNASPSNNQKFFVLNSIFRYQDDGLDSESEDDVVGIQANTPIERTNNAGEHPKEPRKLAHVGANTAQPQSQVNSAAVAHTKNENEARRADVVGGGSGSNGNSRAVPNGTGSNDKKTETSEKSTENGKSTLDQSSQQSTNSTSSSQGVQPPAPVSSSAATSQSKSITTTATATTTSTPTSAAPAPRPQPSSEPKTWANMVSRNPAPTSVQAAASATKTLHPDQQHQNQASHQHQQQSQQQQSHHQYQTQSDQQQNNQNNTNNNNANNNNNNTRRRHMLRKPSNKSNGGGGGTGGGGGGGANAGGGGRGDGRNDGRNDGRGDGRGDGGQRSKNRDRPRPPPAGKPLA